MALGLSLIQVRMSHVGPANTVRRYVCFARYELHLTHSERCVAGFYKNTTDNSSCVACHNHATTLSRGAFLLSQCTCVPGYHSTDFLSFNTSCLECGLGHWCEGNQHRAPCAKVQVFVPFISVGTGNPAWQGKRRLASACLREQVNTSMDKTYTLHPTPCTLQ